MMEWDRRGVQVLQTGRICKAVIKPGEGVKSPPLKGGHNDCYIGSKYM